MHIYHYILHVLFFEIWSMFSTFHSIQKTTHGSKTPPAEFSEHFVPDTPHMEHGDTEKAPVISFYGVSFVHAEIY